jgi:hypothetical protein
MSSSLDGVTKNLRFDGQDYPNAGTAANTLTSAQRVNERTVVLTDKIRGSIVQTREISVSKDGKTLTMTVHVPGRNDPDVLVFDRE